ncbi:MAG: ABC transporter ATP-binding protein [Euryarchaeota archaeon]|nr:ABC transporter ATP-binding protein [Euryarchaeota archaeon]
MIEAKDLTKIYYLDAVQVQALDKINLKIEKGEFISVMGPSGSGKSTLLHLLGGIDRPTFGKIFINSADVTKLSDTELSDLRRDTVGFIFQIFNLIPTLTALENVMVPLFPRGADLKWVEERAKALLSMVGLKERMNHKPTQLSGGERQRVAIARSLVNQPQIILADEPTGELDSKTGREIILLMKKLNEEENVTVVIVTHDPRVSELTERIIYLQDGRIVREERSYD